MRLAGSASYGRWAMGCCMLAMSGTPEALHRLVLFLQGPTSKGLPAGRFSMRRYAWTVFVLESLARRAKLTPQARGWLRATLLLFLYRYSGILRGADIRVPEWNRTVPGLGPPSRVEGTPDRYYNVIGLRQVVAREMLRPLPTAPAGGVPPAWRRPKVLGALGYFALGVAGCLVVWFLRGKRCGGHAGVF